MRIILPHTHLILDCFLELLIIGAPWFFAFSGNGSETLIPVSVGFSTLLYSLFTNYSFSPSHNLSLRSHLTLDMAGGIFLAASPWIFGFSEKVFLPHLILGTTEFASAVMTVQVNEESTSQRPGHAQ